MNECRTRVQISSLNILLLGHGEAGKTTLKNQLANLQLYFSRNPTELISEYNGTVGIEMLQVDLAILTASWTLAHEFGTLLVSLNFMVQI